MVGGGISGAQRSAWAIEKYLEVVGEYSGDSLVGGAAQRSAPDMGFHGMGG